MKGWLACTLLACLLTGCNPPGMSRAEVIAAVKECEAAGLDSRVMTADIDGRIMDVHCYPKENPQ